MPLNNLNAQEVNVTDYLLFLWITFAWQIFSHVKRIFFLTYFFYLACFVFTKWWLCESSMITTLGNQIGFAGTLVTFDFNFENFWFESTNVKMRQNSFIYLIASLQHHHQIMTHFIKKHFFFVSIFGCSHFKWINFNAYFNDLINKFDCS